MARGALKSLAALLVTSALFTGCHLCGPKCEVTQVCCPEVKTEKVEKTGWDVECKQICIPPIHCPCFGDCERTCGKVIAVKKLKADKIECGERCVIEYKLVDGCLTGSGQNCQSCPAGQPCGVAVPEQQPTEAPAPKPVEQPKNEEPLPPSPGVARIHF